MLTTIGTPAMWAGFAALVVVALIVDLVVLNAKGAKKVGFREVTKDKEVKTRERLQNRKVEELNREVRDAKSEMQRVVGSQQRAY